MAAGPATHRVSEHRGGGARRDVGAHAGDVEAYRELVLRHRRRMYRSALRTLGASGDPDDVARDIATHLHTALAVFSAVDR
ncbi:MAG TPA: hypothetical protein VNP92_07910 [Actinophytocola sp.]|nr:hypothetical protein [Actinophytocola sp.]